MPLDRFMLMLSAATLPGWQRVVAIVQPETILRWHRDGFRWTWRRKSKSSAQRDLLRAEPDVLRVLLACVDNAMATPSPLERSFWLDTLVETMCDQPDAERERQFLDASHLIEATFAVGPRERHESVRYVADRLVPIT